MRKVKGKIGWSAFTWFVALSLMYAVWIVWIQGQATLYYENHVIFKKNTISSKLTSKNRGIDNIRTLVDVDESSRQNKSSNAMEETQFNKTDAFKMINVQIYNSTNDTTDFNRTDQKQKHSGFPTQFDGKNISNETSGNKEVVLVKQSPIKNAIEQKAKPRRVRKIVIKKKKGKVSKTVAFQNDTFDSNPLPRTEIKNKTGRRRGRRRRKPKGEDVKQLQTYLTNSYTTLQHWNGNASLTLDIRHRLHNYLNETSPVCTRENTPLGAKYYDTFFNRSIDIEQENHVLLPQTSPLSSAKTFKTCGIIGNGGILINSGCGEEIDNLDFVMRSNLQPIRGFTVDAGSKVSFTSISQSLMTRYRVSENEIYVRNFTNLNTTKLLKDLEEYKGYLLWIPNSKVSNLAFQVVELLKEMTSLEVLLFNPHHSYEIQRFWGLTKRGLSTGMTLLSIGFSMCDEIHLYGFWPFPNDYEGNPLPMHYTNDIAWMTYNKYHDYPTEFSLLIELHRIGAIKMHIGKCLY
ncbi:CMP-N-acetylneuraminate-poly-alpha-2,8-sialyltransferase-like [Saccoglossus kowalevskii]